MLITLIMNLAIMAFIPANIDDFSISIVFIVLLCFYSSSLITKCIGLKHVVKKCIENLHAYSDIPAPLFLFIIGKVKLNFS